MSRPSASTVAHARQCVAFFAQCRQQLGVDVEVKALGIAPVGERVSRVRDGVAIVGGIVALLGLRVQLPVRCQITVFFGTSPIGHGLPVPMGRQQHSHAS